VEKLLRSIRDKILAGEYEYSEHALDQSIIRRISGQELLDAVGSGELVEDYPNDKYGPSCLILGKTRTGRALHIQCSYATRPTVKIITVYEPDPSEWVDYKVRK